MKKQVYLDYAAATPVDEQVLKAMQPFFSKDFYNPSSMYLKSNQVKQALDEARAKVASIAGVKPAEVTFTAGGTEANNLAIQGVARAFPASRIVYSAIEHDSVRVPIKWLQSQGYDCIEVKPDNQGRISPNDIVKAINDKTVLVSVMMANNEIGTIQPVKEIAAVIKNVNKTRQKNGLKLPLYFHSDACQAANYLSVNLNSLGVDMITLNGGKIYGPKQSGALIHKSHVKLEPLVFGGGQEQNMRSGTENVAASVGFAEALELVQQIRKEESKRLTELRDWVISQISEKLPSVYVNGSLKDRLPNNLHLTLPGCDNERVLYALDEQNIQISTGSACSVSKEEPSHVLGAIGLSDIEARSSIRVTMGQQSSKQDLEHLLESLEQLM